MKTIYNSLRILGYLTGMAGAYLFVTGQHSGGPASARVKAGGVLLTVTLLCFVATYVLSVYDRLRKRHVKTL